MKSILLSISLLLATSALNAETTVATTQQVASHKTVAEIIKEGKAGIVATIKAFEREIKNNNPHVQNIKDDLKHLEAIKNASNTVAAKKHVDKLSKETVSAIKKEFDHLSALAALKAFDDWRNNKKIA